MFYYIDGSKAGILMARLTMWNINGKMEKLQFRLADVQDENGDLMLGKVIGEDLRTVQKDIKNNDAFCHVIKNYGINNRLKVCLLKRLLYPDLYAPDNLCKPLFLIRLILWKISREKAKPTRVFLFLRRRYWLSEIQEFADRGHIKIIPVNLRKFNLKVVASRIPLLKYVVRKLLYRGMSLRYYLSNFFFSGKSDEVRDSRLYKKDSSKLNTLEPRLAVEYYGHLNLKSQELFSDLFFWQKSKLDAKDIVVYFGQPKAPLDIRKWDALNEYGMSAIGVHPLGTTIPHAPFYSYLPSRKKIDWRKQHFNSDNDILLTKWLYNRVLDYEELCDYWGHFFTKNKIKVHISWYQADIHCIIADALKRIGGVGVLYQRSYEDSSSPPLIVATDVFFGFSNRRVQFKDEPDCIIPYYVVTGFLGDHRFDLLKKRANDVRCFLQSHGAKRIVAYFDENSRPDSRWCVGHEIMAENFEYLLNKVLTLPWFGLILKPKVPSTLRTRLGAVAELLDQAEETGRCYIFKDAVLQGSFPPAAASLGSDFAIHGNLHAGTAGIESALAGTPTLLLDRDGWSNSSLYTLGKGKVVFRNWDDLWKACQDHWNAPHGMPGFGDWSSMIDDIDPFRDGRAAERMGTYLQWLIEGFKAKLPRETVLSDAAERYSKIWGKDKILSVNCNQKEQELSIR